MTTLIKVIPSSFVVTASLVIFGVASPIHGQKSGKRQLERIKNPADEVRQTYDRRQADGLKVTIYSLAGRELRPVNPGQSFTNGDRIKVRLQSNFDGYIYVINLTPAGEKRLLFPRPLSRRNNVTAGQVHEIPYAGEFRFDEKPGLEVLQILMSRSQIYFLEAVLDRAPPRTTNLSLDKAAQKSLQDLTGKPQRLRGSGIATQTQTKRTAGLQTRELKLEPRKEGSIVILTGGKAANRFAPGEISIFEVRLNHY